jgi:lipoprotein-anchoring transpeptidase ErfK/SrfK
MGVFRSIGPFVLALLAAAALAGVAAPSAGQLSRVPVGVSVAGLPVGGFSSEETRLLLRSAYAAPVTFALGERRWRASAEELGVSAAVDDAVARALGAEPGTELVVEATPSQDRLQEYLARLARRLARKPQDARLVGLDEKLRPVIAREIDGRRLDREATAAAIETAVRSAQREPVHPRFHVVKATRTKRTFGPAIVIRRESKGLYVYLRGKLVRRLGVATGTWEYPTPLGSFEIVDRQYNPWWYPPSSEWARGLQPVPPGPGNPLGTRWMGLDVYGVGIHGTPDAASIGYSASHGCIRMHIWEAEWLFERVRLGTPVVIVAA